MLLRFCFLQLQVDRLAICWGEFDWCVAAGVIRKLSGDGCMGSLSDKGMFRCHMRYRIHNTCAWPGKTVRSRGAGGFVSREGML